MQGFLGVITTLSAQSPLLVIVEDAHWSDEASLDLLLSLARRFQPDAGIPVASDEHSLTVGREMPVSIGFASAGRDVSLAEVLLSSPPRVSNSSIKRLISSRICRTS